MHKTQILAAAAIFLSSAAMATTTVGTPNGSPRCFPFACNISGTSSGPAGTYYQIYSSSAFSGLITFDTISFADGGAGGAGDLIGGTYDITFYTTTGGLSSNFALGPFSNLATFLNQTLAGSVSTGGFLLTGSPYTYDPATGNLVMQVSVTNQALVSPANASYLSADNSGSVMNRIFVNPGQNPVHDNPGFVTTFSMSAVPEPASWTLMLMGFGGLGLALRRNRRALQAA